MELWIYMVWDETIWNTTGRGKDKIKPTRHLERYGKENWVGSDKYLGWKWYKNLLCYINGIREISEANSLYKSGKICSGGSEVNLSMNGLGVSYGPEKGLDGMSHI